MDRALIEYLPTIMQNVGEFKQLLCAEQKQVTALWNACDLLLHEAFLDSATEHALKHWESVLNIVPKNTDSNEVRRFRVHGKLIEDLPYTYRNLHRQLAALCGENGYTLELHNEDYTLRIRVALTSKKLKDEVVSLADRVSPANLILDIDLLYNTHRALGWYTHRELKSHTHHDLKEERLTEKEGSI